MLLATVLLLRSLPSFSSSTGGGNCSAFYSSLAPARVDAQRWCEEGSYFTFASPANAGVEVQLFGRCSQTDTSKLTIVLGHGWPTSSFDFQALSALLEPSLRGAAAGLPLSVWAVDTDEQLTRVFVHGPRDVISNRPRWARRTLAQWHKEECGT